MDGARLRLDGVGFDEGMVLLRQGNLLFGDDWASLHVQLWV